MWKQFNEIKALFALFLIFLIASFISQVEKNTLENHQLNGENFQPQKLKIYVSEAVSRTIKQKDSADNSFMLR
jgi:hypothetical protein